MNPSIFKAYDIRGLYPQDINEENIVSIVKAIYTFFINDLKKEDLTIVLGRDMRISSPALFEKAKETLVEMGATVVDVGLVSTPTFYFAILDGAYDAGIQISASHNPKEYNGIKFAKRDSQKLVKIGKNTGMDQIRELALGKNFYTPTKRGSVTKKQNVVVDEVNSAIKSLSPTFPKKLKVVADPGNAMGALYLEELFKNTPCELIKMNFELDGTFPAHQPDPLQFSTLESLQKKVVEEKADLGIAPDGDGDRVFFINERGEVVPSTLITSLIADKILKRNPSEKVIVDVRYTNNVKRVCENNDAKFSLSRVGHALITEQLNNEGAAFAGESSGHFYFRQTGGAESSVRVILYVLEAIERENKPISQILSKFESSFESGEVNFVLPENLEADKILREFSQSHRSGVISWLDGLSIDYPDWRFNIRTSNTEPLLRLNLEADNKTLMELQLEKFLKQLQSLGARRK